MNIMDSIFDIVARRIGIEATEQKVQRFVEITSMGLFGHNCLVFRYLVTRSVYKGHRNDYPSEPVFNLTRSGFTGQQKFGVAVWSGYVLTNWKKFREQITDGLNFFMSDLPYWTTDIGVFFRDSYSINSAYDDLYTNNQLKTFNQMVYWLEATSKNIVLYNGTELKVELKK